MHKERLLQMVTMLRGLPPETETDQLGFHLRAWNCGTTACAVGHACLSPEFKAQGLSWDNACGGMPAFEDSDSWSAVERFFSLTPGQATYLFYDMEYPDDGKHTTASDVADRIEHFIAENAGA